MPSAGPLQTEPVKPVVPLKHALPKKEKKVVVGRRTLTSLKWSWKSKSPFLVLVLKTLKPFPALDLSIRKPDRCKGRGTAPTQVG